MSGSSERKGRARPTAGREVRVSASEDTAQLLELAVGLHRAGELERARGLYEQLIERDPGHADALQFLGLACFQLGDGARGAAHIRRAIEHKPGVAAYHDNLGAVLESNGALEEALAAYHEAARLAGEDAERCFNTGVVLHRLGRDQEAEAAYRRAVALEPADRGFHFNLANLLKERGRLDDAVAHFRQAIGPGPESAAARTNLGNTLRALGRLEEARLAYIGALEVAPDDAAAHFNLANVHREQSLLESAAEGYAKVVARNPDHLDARLALAQVQRGLGRFDAALAGFQALIERCPENSAAYLGLASVLRFVPVDAYRPRLCALIQRCFEIPEVQAQNLASATAAQLRAHYGLDEDAADVPALVERLAADPLLSEMLTRTINTDPLLEAFLTRLRASLLLGEEDALVAPAVLRLATAMALQCFINEFVFSSSAAEREAAERLRARVEQALAGLPAPDDALRRRCALLAMSGPLLSIQGADRLARWGREAWGETLWPLIERTVCEPLQERELEAGIGSIGEIRDAGSVAVREQYEQHPYPRWLELARREPQSYRDYLARRFHHLALPEFLCGPLEVLAAGCGTGQEAVAIAATRTSCTVLGLDLSRRSLAYGARMAKKLAVEGVDFVQGDILDVQRLGRRFHVVESTGVLHHMADPLAGWRALRDCLQARGLMRIGLYSERARSEVVLAREEIRAAGLAPVDTDIREFRTRVLSAPADSPLAALAQSEDLYTMSACRDLLFHALEHRFTIPGIAAALERLELDFVGFDPSVPGVLQDYRAFNPGDSSMTDLGAWERFEASRPELFSTLYVFWCQKRC